MLLTEEWNAAVERCQKSSEINDLLLYLAVVRRSTQILIGQLRERWFQNIRNRLDLIPRVLLSATISFLSKKDCRAIKVVSRTLAVQPTPRREPLFRQQALDVFKRKLKEDRRLLNYHPSSSCISASLCDARYAALLWSPSSTGPPHKQGRIQIQDRNCETEVD